MINFWGNCLLATIYLFFMAVLFGSQWPENYRGRFTVKREKRGQTDLIDKAQMRESQGYEWELVAIWPLQSSLRSPLCKNAPGHIVAHNEIKEICSGSPLRVVSAHNDATLLHLFTKYTTQEECTTGTAALWSISPNITWYHSHASYWCECSDSNKRASLARHTMPLHLSQCIRKEASK